MNMYETVSQSQKSDRCFICCYIPLTLGKAAWVDPEWWVRIHHLPWKAKKSKGGFYAYYKKRVDGKVIFTYMHRLIANTLPGYETHHKNLNSLDNRKANLANLTTFEHEQLHAMLRISKRRATNAA